MKSLQRDAARKQSQGAGRRESGTDGRRTTLKTVFYTFGDRGCTSNMGQKEEKNSGFE